MFEIEPLINKTVAFRYKGKELEFDLSHALFSSFDVDAGTRLLLKEVAQDPVLDAASLVLDAGCGTGVIGISLAAALPRARFILEDRDTLACEFSFHNCKKNGISASLFSLDGALSDSSLKRKTEYEAESRTRQETDTPDTPDMVETLAAPDAPQVLIYPGLLAGQSPYAEAYGGSDVVISNVPAKAGASVLTDFFESCQARLLRPSGRLAFVIVNTLVEVVDAWRAQSPMHLISRTQGPSHTVFILEKPAHVEKPAHGSDRCVQRDYPTSNSFSKSSSSLTFDLSPYFRSHTTFALGKRHAVPIKATGFWGLPEFDTPSYATQLAVETLENLAVLWDVLWPCHSGNVVDRQTLQLGKTSKPENCPGTETSFFVYEPGIGLSALWVKELFHPAKIELASRNVLSLLATRFNLESESKDLANGKNIGLPDILQADILQARSELEPGQPAREDIILRSALEVEKNRANAHSLVLWFCDEIPEYNYIETTLEMIDSLLQTGGIAVVIGTSAAIARLEKRRPSALRRLSTKKLKGFSSLALAKSI